MGILEPHDRHRRPAGRARIGVLAADRRGGGASGPPAIIVHGLADAEAALAAAAGAGAEILLLSAAGAAATVGPAWFAAVVARAAAACPGARFTAILDCGDAAGLALAALRHGIGAVSLEAPPRLRARVAAIAAAHGAALVSRPRRALDLLDRPDAAAACRDYLGRTAPARDRRPGRGRSAGAARVRTEA